MTVSLKLFCIAAVVAIVPMIASASSASAADDIKLSSNQRISCGRGLMAGKLQTSSCRSYAYVFNDKTTQYYRCSAGVPVTKDNKALLKMDTEGSCQKKARL